MKQEGRGATDFHVVSGDAKDLKVIKWDDVKTVIMLSNCIAAEFIMTVWRYNNKEQKYIEVQCPGI